MTEALFVDSWGWIALANAGEESHETVKKIYREACSSGYPVVTTDYLLDETITFLFNRIPAVSAVKYIQGLTTAIEANLIRLEGIDPERFRKAWQMRIKYQNRPDISFTDFTSFVVMKEKGIHRVLTNDSHFEQVNLGFQKTPQTLPNTF